MEGEGKKQKEAMQDVYRRFAVALFGIYCLPAKFLIPMAVSLGFGVLFATLITLLLIPCGFFILEDRHHVWRVIRERLTNLKRLS